MIEDGERALACGDWATAEQAARAALAGGETMAARLLLGRALVGLGRGRDGLGQFARAVELDPRAVAPRALLGEVLALVGRADDAAAAWRGLLALEPGHVAARLRLVDHLAAAGRREAAFAQLGDGILAAPGEPALYVRLARLLVDDGRPTDAAAACERALGLDPRHGPALALRADLLLTSDPAGALASFNDAIGLHPDDPTLRFGRARALHRLGRLDAAVAAMTVLAEARPDDPAIRYELALILREAGDVERSEAVLRALVADRPSFLPARLTLARLLGEQGRVAAAVALQAETIAAFPTEWEERASYGTNLLRLGRFREGFAEHEHRLRTGRIEAPANIGWYPMWQGERLDGRMLWLYPEQGFGDMIQFLRFVPFAAERSGGRVALGIFPPLAQLCAGLPGVAQLVTDEVRPDRGAVRCPLMSLADRLEITRDTLPAAVPYLTVPAEARAVWRGRFDHLGGRRVGLVWSGNARHTRDAARSLPPNALAPLAAMPRVSFVSLNRGGEAAVPLRLCDPGPIGDFADTAAIVEQLDLVIAVDTAVAHLAGALGRPVWTLLDFEGDWRWLAGADRSPWYPTMRLFRQPRPGDWAAVMAEVAAALAEPRLTART